MTAFVLSLAVFSVWSVFGWSLISVLGSRRNLLRNALLAPAVGAAALTLLLFEVYRFGVPIRIGGPVVTVAALVAAAVLLNRVRPALPARALLPFIGLLLVAAFLTGRPMLTYGFDWVSFCNDDMANYILTAHSILARGFLSQINPADVVENRDPSVSFWVVTMLGGLRCGSELVLAWVMSCTGIDGLSAFMPTILALQMVLVAAGSALVCGGRRYRVAALAACGWLALSSLISLGTLYQLIAQVFGLALMAAAAVFLLSPDPGAGRESAVRRALAAAILVAGLGVCYPEVLPFLFLAFGLYHSVAIARGKESWKPLLKFVVLLGGLTIALLNAYAEGMVTFLRSQITRGAAHGVLSNILFPYYLIPSGLAVFWGFEPIAGRTPHPAIDIYIVLGAGLLAAGAVASLWLAWNGEAAGVVATVMLVLAVRLFMTKSDFGLYKLAMYLQPFLLGAMTLAWFSICWRGEDRSRWTAWKVVAFFTPIALIAAWGAAAQQHYVRISASSSAGASGFVEIPDATSDRIVAHLEALAAKPRRTIVLSDSPNVVLAKFEAPYLTPSSQRFPARNYFGGGAYRWTIWPSWYADLMRPGYAEAARALLRERDAWFTPAKFDMHGSAANGFSLERNPREPGFSDAYTLVATGPRQTILNRSSEPKAPGRVRLIPSEQVRNHLVLIESDFGRNYYRAGADRLAGRVAMFQLEPDYFFPNQTMSAIGRVLLFQVLNPSGKFRVVMNYTASLKSDGRNVIPPVNVIGDARAAFPVTGRGSARLFSPPVAPQEIQGGQYVSIDMGTDGQRFSEQRSGLMRAFGTDIPLDARTITGFARDISVMDDDQFAALHPPAMVGRFPDDLGNTSLEYSGIYEDGWVAESSFLRLLQPPDSSILRIRATVPGLAAQPSASALRVVMGGLTVAQVALRPGENDVKIPLQGAAMIQRIELHFDRAVRLPSPDNRLVSALLHSVGFEETANERTDITAAPITLGDHWYPFEKFGGNTFRWVANDAQFRIHSIRPAPGILEIELESGPGLASKPFRLELRGERGKSWVLAAHGGREILRAPVTLREGNNSFSFHITGGGLPTPHDPRTLNFRVFSLTWLPQQ